MPIYRVSAQETIEETCDVEADNREDAMNMVQNINEIYKWTVQESVKFEIIDAVLVEVL